MKKTAFHDIHEELNAKMIDFAGYMMPVQYEGVNIEHITCLLYTSDAADE